MHAEEMLAPTKAYTPHLLPLINKVTSQLSSHYTTITPSLHYFITLSLRHTTPTPLLHLNTTSLHLHTHQGLIKKCVCVNEGGWSGGLHKLKQFCSPLVPIIDHSSWKMPQVFEAVLQVRPITIILLLLITIIILIITIIVIIIIIITSKQISIPFTPTSTVELACCWW